MVFPISLCQPKAKVHKNTSKKHSLIEIAPKTNLGHLLLAINFVECNIPLKTRTRTKTARTVESAEQLASSRM